MELSAAITLALQLIDKLGALSAVIQAVQARGDTKLSADEWASIVAQDTAAMNQLAADAGMKNLIL